MGSCDTQSSFTKTENSQCQGELLTDAERERLNRFPEDVSREDIRTHFTLTYEALSQVDQRRGDANRIGFALQLLTLRYLGFVSDDIHSIHTSVVEFVSHQLDIPVEALSSYGTRTQTRTSHQQRIESYLGYRSATSGDLEGARLILMRSRSAGKLSRSFSSSFCSRKSKELSYKICNVHLFPIPQRSERMYEK